jgi:hypothetical protein
MTMRRKSFILCLVSVVVIIVFTFPSSSVGKGEKKPVETTPLDVKFYNYNEFNGVESRIRSDDGEPYIDGEDGVEAVLWSGSRGSQDMTVNLYSSDRRIQLHLCDEDPPGNSDCPISENMYCPYVFIDRLADVPITSGDWHPVDNDDDWCGAEADSYDGPNICVVHGSDNHYVLRRATFYIDEDIKRKSFQLRFQSQPSVLDEVGDLIETVYVRVYHPEPNKYIIYPETEAELYTIPDIFQEDSPSRAGVLVFSRTGDYACGFFGMPFYLEVVKQ